jgi:hypothetical protein
LVRRGGGLDRRELAVFAGRVGWTNFSILISA